MRLIPGASGRLFQIAVVFVACHALAQPAPAQTPEYRAMWVSRFEWPNANPATCKAAIDGHMQNLADAHFNAVFFQVRGQADVLYPSPYEVWSPLIGGVNPGWDPLAYAIQSAHSHGLEFHAYMNTHTCWQSNPASAHTLPSNPNHVFYAHANAADPAHRDWLHYDNTTNPVQFSESDYVWFAPGVPAVQAYVRQQYVYVAQNYAVDGIHYDRIRTPWSNQPSYDPISWARFNNPQSNPNGLNLTQWTADQITRNVRDIYAAVMAVNPSVKISAAVYPNATAAPSEQHQDARTWAQTGGLDILVPMMYSTGGAGSTWDSRLQTWLAGDGGRHVIAGQITSQGITSLLEQVALTRQRGAQGNNVFSITSFSWWSDYLAQVYATPVSTPAMPWKTAPTMGIIQGFVTDSVGQPVVDAQVVRTGSSYIGLTTGDGYYSFLLVPPGTYTLAATHPGFGNVQATNVVVTAGSVVRRDIQFGAALAPIITEVAPDPDGAHVGEEYTRTLQLSQGSATSWTLLAGPAGAVVSASGVVSGWTPQPGDVGQSITITVRATNAGGSDDESWSVAVSAAPACNSAVIGDFDDYATGTRVLFRNPRYSGTTSDDLAASPDTAEVTAEASFTGNHSYKVAWQFLDGQALRWMRLTTNTVANVPNPTVPFNRPIRVRLRLDSGSLRVCLGLRETGTSAPIGEDGGASGTIEWVGAASDISGAPQGRLVTAQSGVWQTLVFDPLIDPVHGMTGSGTLSSPTGYGVLEHLAFSIVSGAGPYTVYVDDVTVLCDPPAAGDLDVDGDADLLDYEILADCMQGPEVAVGSSCLDADLDGDGDVDLDDAAAFQSAYTGAY
jgi:uncharacterized lipoprotein YddW (UPF0748 family)